jgi:Xaa-Pro aminopeptidase
MQNILEGWCDENKIDAVLVTAQDAFLSEYTPLSANFRHALSGFSGSTGDGIFVSSKLAEKISAPARFQLFVDGRYHLQADQETKQDEVLVHKFGLASGLDESLYSWMRSALPAGCRIAVDLQRVSWNRWRALEVLTQESALTLVGIAGGGLASALPDMKGWRTDRPVRFLDEQITGRTTTKNLRGVRAAIEAKLGHSSFIYATCMSDDAAWLLNARGYHLPQLSSVLAYTFLTNDLCLIHLPEESQACELQLPAGLKQFEITRGPLENALNLLQSAVAGKPPATIAFSGRAMNAALPKLLKEICKDADLRDDVHVIEELRATKTTEELNAIRASFLRSSKAIARTLRFAKDCGRKNVRLSETDLAEKIKAEYASEGALELSFKTISGFAANGAVIHYSTPDKNKTAKSGDLLLLDSGAYYAEGFATDCTRVVLFTDGSEKAADWQKEIYTLTLKSCLAGLRAKFRLDSLCKDVDTLARGPIRDKGFDYAHGTGHGIGIHVHESGIRISPVSQYQFTESAVVSVEPGIYLAGKGGVRIENVAIVAANAEQEQQHTHGFENVVFVGYDWDLIDLGMLSEDDKKDLAAYERKCRSLGTGVTDCPLL